MQIRVQLSKEFIQDLAGIHDENNVLLRETLNVRTLTPYMRVYRHTHSMCFMCGFVRAILVFV